MFTRPSHQVANDPNTLYEYYEDTVKCLKACPNYTFLYDIIKEFSADILLDFELKRNAFRSKQILVLVQEVLDLVLLQGPFVHRDHQINLRHQVSPSLFILSKKLASALPAANDVKPADMAQFFDIDLSTWESHGRMTQIDNIPK